MTAPVPTRAGRAGESQPLPVPNGAADVQSAVIADIERRREVGIERYGTALQPHNGRNALLDLYEELLDAAMYVKQRLIEEDESVTAPRPLTSDEAAELASQHRGQFGDDVVQHDPDDGGGFFACEDCDWIVSYAPLGEAWDYDEDES